MDNKILLNTRRNFKLKSLKLRISNLKKKLANDDYKIIKCMEFKLVNPDASLKDMPYDVEELVAKRNGLRELINESESSIAELEGNFITQNPEEDEAEETEQTDVPAQGE